MLDIVLSSIGYSIENILAKLAITQQNWNPIQLIIKRYAYFGIMVILYLLFFNFKTIQTDFKDPTRLKYPILIGIMGVVGGIFLYKSFGSRGIAVAVPAVNGCSVLLTALFGFFVLKEGISIQKTIGIIFIIFGLILTG